jgi:two-component system, sensor histidine kinase RpfC
LRIDIVSQITYAPETKLNLINSMKVWLSNIISFVGLRNYGEEYQQALMRVLIVSSATLFVSLSSENITPTLYFLIIAYPTVAILLLIHTRLQPKLSTKRQLFSLLADVSGTSISVYLTNDVGSVFIGVYLWLVIGYGLRFGRTMLLAAYCTSLIGFVMASVLSNHWLINPVAFYGLLFTLISIPLYALALLTRLKEATNKAENASKAKSQFLSHMSHEIRTPLNGIVGACSLLANTPISKEQKKLFDVVHSSSELLVQLVNDVLDISQIESGKIVSKVTNFNLQDLVESAVNLFSSQAKAKNIMLSHDIANDTPLMLQGELLHIKQVLINLIGNAVKFTENGSVSLTVKVTKQTENQASILFEIADTGIGIEEGAIKTIFESFTQANNSIKNKFGGTGLGTTISKNLIAFMGGNLNVESELGVGSKFWFEIALDKDSENLLENQIEHSLVNAQASSSEILVFSDFKKPAKKQVKSYRVLVADDNEVNSMIITQILLQHNHQVDVVKNGELALDKLRDSDYDLMILDGNMPIMGGMEVVQIYQALNIGKPQIPTIILSADATIETIESFKEIGVGAYLTKPIQINLLIQTIEDVVSQSTFKTAEVIDYTYARQDSAKPESQNGQILLNISRLDSLKQLDANSRFVEKLILDFMADTEQRITLLNAHTKNRDFIQIKACTHTIAGSAGNVGADELAKLCENLSQISPSDNFKEIELLISEAIDTYASTKVYLWDYLNQQNIDQQMPK